MQPPHPGAPVGGGGGGQQSLHDMQRFQQQLQAQYRQQQALQQQQQQQQNPFGAGGQLGTLQQQQQAAQLAAMQQQQGHPSINQTSTIASMMQQQQGNNPMLGMSNQQHMPAPSNTSLSANAAMSCNSGVSGMPQNNVGNPFNSWTNPLQQQQQQQQQPQPTPSPMDASSGTSARLMAMAGMAGASAFSGSGSTALQNMQAVLLQQRQQAAQQQQQQQQRNSMSGGLSAANFTSAAQQVAAAQAMQQQQQQQTKPSSQSNNNSSARSTGGAPSASANMLAGMQGSSSSASANMMASIQHGMQGFQGNNAATSQQQQQQQLLFQQHLAAMQNQQQQQQMGRGSSGAGAVNAMAAMQNSMQQQQQQAHQQGGSASSNSMQSSQQGSVGLGSLQQQQQGSTQQSLLQQQQQSRQHQQLLQQMQQNQRAAATGAGNSSSGGNSNNNSSSMIQQMQQQQRNSGSMLQLQNSANSMMGMLAQQQSQMPGGIGQQMQDQSQASGTQQGGGGGDTSSSNKFGAPGPSNTFGQQQQPQQAQAGLMGSNLSGLLGGHSQRSTSDESKLQQQQQPTGHFGGGGGDGSSNNSVNAGSAGVSHANSGTNLSSLDASNPADSGAIAQMSAEQKSFLDGRFAGGWQSNADLPDRRRVIFNILEVIRQMRPDTSKLSNKLPHMAKSLEEHLYRSAKSKEDYMDLATLKKRLQAIAHGLEIHRSSDSAPSIKPGDFLGTSQQGISALGTAAGSDGNVPTGQNVNWSVANSLRGHAQGLSGLAAQLSSSGQMNLAGQLSSAQQQQQLLGSVPQQKQQGNTMAHQAASSTSPASFMMPSSAASQQAPQMQQQQQSGLWQSQNSGADSSLMSQLQQQQQHLQQMGQQTSLGNNNMGMQHGEAPLGNDSLGHDASSLGGGSTGSFPNTRASFSNVAPTSQLNPASGAPWGSTGSNAPTPAAPVPAPADSSREYSRRSSKFQDPTTGQKTRVILQQQQRLLLLRHASKCNAGSSCTTKFCEQMVTLWKHMKTCRDKNCKTSHCLSSRCVLNHYRICKSNGRTSTCEVCGPVMLKIKQQERDDGTTEDPLTRDQDSPPPPQQDNVPSAGGHDHASQQHPIPSDLSQIQQVQAQQSKLKAQLDSLKLLQGQQEQLLEQQKSLEQQAQHVKDPNSPQARQLQEQQILLQQLQKRCQQQMLLVQQELQMQTSSMGSMGESRAQQVQADKPDAGISGSEAASASKPRANQTVRRRGSGVGAGKGKRFMGKTLGLTGAPRASGDASEKKKRGSTKIDRAAKKSKPSKTKSNEKPEDTPPDPATPEATDHTSLVSCMTKEEIGRHLESLNKQIILSSRTVTHKCRPVLQELLDDQFGWVFREAVDPVALGLPDYFDVIKNPMHLDLVRKKVENAIYGDMESFARDVRLVFQNAILYNGESSEVGELAQSMMSKFDKAHNAVVQDIECSHLNLESQGELCSLCGVQKKRFEPTVLYCQGICGMQRIKRNANYYTDRTKQNHWCEACFEVLQPGEPILLDDGCEVLKKELQVFKNDALPEEGWVNCDECHSWVHQICALFNGRTNKSTARYTCPTCYVRKPRSDESVNEAKKTVKGAEDLMRFKMSDAIEQGMEAALQTAYAARASELGVTIDQVEKAEGLSVRVVSNVDKKQFVGEKMMKKYAAEGCPNEYPVRTKCIALFQKRHGVDTLLFALYVFEYGHECPAPNKRRVYISYLDSVQYFEPKCYRTAAYHSILIEYLRYVKKRGFHTAHIWSCPPTPGDDYIFYCHPKHQLVPREDMLRAWYIKALDQAKAQGIVIRTTTLYDEYFTNNGVDPVPGQRRNPTCLPYFEGDYIPGEIENIIENQENAKKKGAADSASSSHDSVMARVGHNLKKMKDNFIVVHLRNRRFAAAVERGEDVSNWKEDSDDEVVKSKRAKISGKSSAVPEPLAPIKPSASIIAETNPSVLEPVDRTKLRAITEPKLPADEDDTKDAADSIDCQNMDGAESEKVASDMPSSADSVAIPAEDTTASADETNTTGDADKKLTEEASPKEEKADSEGGKATDKEVPEAAVAADDKETVSEDESAKKRDTAAQAEGATSIAEAAAKAEGASSIAEAAAHAESAASSAEAAAQAEGGISSAEAASQAESAASSADAAAQAEGGISSAEAAAQAEGGIASAEAAQAEGGTSRAEAEAEGAEVVLHTESAASSAEAAAQAEGATSSAEAAPEAEGATSSAEAAAQAEGATSSAEAAAQAESATSSAEAAAQAECTTSSAEADAKVDTAGEKEAADIALATTGAEDNALDKSSKEKRAREEVNSAVAKHLSELARSASPVGDTVDEDPPLESEMFESRQQFLNYCQTTHCQFDELRRAKHSSVMVLFQLHNPMAPKFLQQCGACYRDITHGVRYHCKECSNFDLCEDCYEPVTSGLWAKRDSRFAHDKKHKFTPIDMEAAEETQKSRSDRQKSLKAHIELLEHAGACDGAPGCSLHNCQRLKKLFLHVPVCDVKPKKDCKICTRLFALATMHSRMCTAQGACPIPFCDRVRDRQKRLRKQQQLMDDRRRQAQNELYRAEEG